MYGARSVPEMRSAGRHRAGPPPDPAGGSSTGEDIEARLLGQRRWMRPREVSAKASVSLMSARKLWHALGFPKAGDEDTVFTDADLAALRSVATLVREGVLDEPTALAMTRALARTTDRLAVSQTQLVAESIGERVSTSDTRAVPDPMTARAAARKLADLADDLEPLLVYAWRRHLAAALSRMLSDSEPTALVDDGLAGSLTPASGFETSPMRRRTLDGIGPVTPWTLGRADPAGRRGMMGVDGARDDGSIADDDGEIRGVWSMSELSSPTRPLVRITRHGPGDHIAELALDRPEAMNAVSTQMARELSAACDELSADPGVRVVLVTSTSSKAFCVGADLKERHGFTDADLMAQRPVARAAYSGVLNLPMPTIAVVEGFALGGGLEIALSCDLIIAGSGAVVGLPEVSVGVIPGGGGTQLLTRRIGWSRAAGMIFTARRMPAAEAAALGVVDEVLEAGTAWARGLELAAQIAANSPVGLRQAKRAMRLGSDVDLATGLEVEDGCWRATAFSSDRAEGVAAFAEKRPARWSALEAEDGSTMRS